VTEIPVNVRDVLRRLASDGYEAWCVGGCVRDILLKRTPNDWDIATSAHPEETMRIFGDLAQPTGLRHGTVTVRTPEGGVEVTTYRRDGTYADHRHPDSVSFSSSITEDLARRDFTVNAMAMGPDGMVQDPFEGQQDLQSGVLRCVGNPDARFREDALRILRCLRFSSVLNFSIEPHTEDALRKNRHLLSNIAPERIREELVKLLCGPRAAEVLEAYPDVLGVFLPEILPLVGFDQRNRHHCYDVWVHTAKSVLFVESEPVLKVTMLLHDLGKPACFTLDDTGNGHFRGHPLVSGKLAAEILRRLRFNAEEQHVILLLVENHDRVIARTDKGVRQALMVFGERNFHRLMSVKRADNLAQAPEFRWVQDEIDKAEAIMNALLEQDACFSLRQLAVNGRDLIAIGLRGREIGKTLNALLSSVVNGELPNERTALLKAAAMQKTRGSL
jgi:tRNA nucleotidyltransferase (CCA-adding enzyme)